MKLPMLFKKTSTGADQFWLISTEDNLIVTEWGQVGGSIQTTKDIIEEGKNIGRSNETTSTQQAEAEAQAQFQKKLKRGYVLNLDDARQGKVDAIIEGGIVPMLAKKYADQADKIKWPAFAQPKLDGHRCIAVIKDGVATLWSRTRKPITSVPHIITALEKAYPNETLVLDGELYNEAYHDKFEELSHFIRQETPEDGCEIVHYHIYDVAGPGKFCERYLVIGEKLGFESEYLHLVRTIPVENEEQLMDFFNESVADGYEGCMVRNADSLYVNKRSSDLLKVKEMDDAEFLIIGIEEGRGKLTGHAIFVCETDEGNEFRVKMKGDTSKLKEFFERPETCVGKMVTVKYQGFTAYGLPRFPIAVRLQEEV